MRIISVELENFASYNHLEFCYSGQGLTQLTGLTGSGKSTLCDAIPWCLFGRTAKGGTVDEVLSWPGDQITFGNIQLSVNNTYYNIIRTRGPKAKDNDLFYYTENFRENVRGKDLNDTQKIINNLLGMDYDLYLAAAYYHEFSQTAQFFNTTAKIRRQMCEQLVDLSLATTLQPKLADQAKLLVKQESENSNAIYGTRMQIELLKRMFTAETVRFNEWNLNKTKRIAAIKAKYDSFASDRALTLNNYLDQEAAWIAKLDAHHAATTCPECGGPKKAFKSTTDPVNPYTALIQQECDRENTYEQQLIDLELEDNPHKTAAEVTSVEIQTNQDTLDRLNMQTQAISLGLDDINTLRECIDQYRSISIQNAISDLEANTNSLLETHFDAEIRVEFVSSDADKIDVTISKDGNLCSFTQLSKGQRGILKLCFAVSVMQAVQNHHGIKCDQLFFDEATDGLDDSMRVKAADLLSTLVQSYNSIFLVDHSEAVKAVINNKYHVELINGQSVVEKS